MAEKKTGMMKYFVLLHLLLFFNSMTGICSKFAAKEEFLSVRFILLYGMLLIILGTYAFFWQQLLKHIPLITAFCNKAVTIFWGIVWGALLFKEKVTITMIIGAVVVIIGVILVVTSDE